MKNSHMKPLINKEKSVSQVFGSWALKEILHFLIDAYVCSIVHDHFPFIFMCFISNILHGLLKRIEDYKKATAEDEMNKMERDGLETEIFVLYWMHLAQFLIDYILFAFHLSNSIINELSLIY